MSKKKLLNEVGQLTLFAEDFHVRTSLLPENGRDLLESEAAYGTSLQELLTNLSRDGLLPKMSPVFCPATEDGTLPSSFPGWSNGGMAFVGGYLMLNTSDWPRDASVCSLSQVLETDVAPKYYLSAKACSGILRRAEKRGKELPRKLLEALTRVVQEQEGRMEAHGLEQPSKP